MEKIRLASKQEIVNMSEETLNEYIRSFLKQVEKISFTELKKFCTPLKEYYKQTKQNILSGTASYDFLVYFFSKYHPNWDEKTHGFDVEYFRVECAEQSSTFCFYLYINGIREDIGFSGIALKFKKINDITRACREAVRPYITDFKKKILETSVPICPITNVPLTASNIAVHHENLEFDNLVKNWVSNYPGGEDEVFKYVNETVGNGTITKFTDEELVNNFVDYHNKHTKVCVLSVKGHKIRHQEIKNFKKGISVLKKHPINWYILPIINDLS